MHKILKVMFSVNMFHCTVMPLSDKPSLTSYNHLFIEKLYASKWLTGIASCVDTNKVLSYCSRKSAHERLIFSHWKLSICFLSLIFLFYEILAFCELRIHCLSPKTNYAQLFISIKMFIYRALNKKNG